MKWNEAAIGAAFRSLPLRTDMEPDIGSEVEAFRFAAWAGHANALARARPATRLQTQAELKKLCDLCRELHEHINTTMRSPALRMVEASIAAQREEREQKGQLPLYHPIKLTIQIEGTFAAARDAWMQAKAGADLPQPEATGTKPDAAMVADYCAERFEGLTGKGPTIRVNSATNTAYGPFIDFLTQIFGALGIEASPVSQARAAIEKRAEKTA